MSNVAKVGLFASIALVLLAALILRVEEIDLFGGARQEVEVLFDTVTGLDDKAAVRVAGVRVGRVDGISLDGQRARVRLVIDTPVTLKEGAYASVANVGLLGEKYVELVLGPPDAPPLPPGTTLEGQIPVSWDEAMAKLSNIGDSVLQFTEGVTGTGTGGNLGRLIDNLAEMSGELRDLVASNRGQVDATLASFESFSATLARELPVIARQTEDALAQIESVIADNRDDFGEGLANVRELTESFKTSVENINRITSQLAEGEGSIGKLLTSDEAHDGLVATLDSLKGGVEDLRGTLGRIERIQLDLGFESYYLEQPEDARFAFKLDIDPQSSRFYRIEAVDDPVGRRRRQVERITTTLADGTTETETIETFKLEDKILISAQLGFDLAEAEYGQFSLRGGLIESTGGAGLDWRAPTRRFGLSLEAFNFGRDFDDEELAPRLRLTGKYLFNDNVYVVGGYDDFLESDLGSAFLGLGIRWNDDDLKYLLGSVPVSTF